MAASPSTTGDPGGRRVLPLTISGLVVAAALGAILVQALGTPPPSASIVPYRPVVTVVAAPVYRGGALSLGGGIPDAPAHIFIAGRVLAVSGHSITIGGPSHTVTARLTHATTCNGRIIRATAVKVGDMITARIDNSDSGAVVTALQAPAQIR
jgi:hypothetical protein